MVDLSWNWGGVGGVYVLTIRGHLRGDASRKHFGWEEGVRTPSAWLKIQILDVDQINQVFEGELLKSLCCPDIRKNYWFFNH